MRATNILWALAGAALISTPAFAQQATDNGQSTGADSAPAAETKTAKAPLTPEIVIQNLRPVDKRGLNVFEAPKETDVPFTGFKLSWGAAFTQQFQDISHENTAAEVLSGSTNVNKLQDIGAGFNNANANLYLNAQLAPGIRVALTSYLSSRHHNETWVKDGYLLIDASPIEYVPLQTLMKYVTVRAGHFEVNYGDAHFRRTDNGNAMYNPFVGNLIMDAFTTEIGGEVYVRARGFMAMGGITGGEIRGNVTQPDKRSPAFLAKLGYDRQLNGDLRIRLTGSTFQQAKAISNTLYAGDRAGSRYYWVMENTLATESANFRSGMLNPGFGSKVKAYMVNPFVKFRGLELFGVAETAEGRSATDSVTRTFNQYSGDLVYRFLPQEQLWVGARYNTVKGPIAQNGADVSIDRSALSAGWFITPTIMLKGEYVNQKYNDFATTDIRNGGKFNGYVVEGVVAF